MGLFRGFFGTFFKRLFSARTQYLLLSGQGATGSVRLGVTGIVMSVLGMLFSIGFTVLGALCAANLFSQEVGGEYKWPIASLIGAIAFFGLAACCCGVIMSGSSHALYQKRLNDRKVGTAAVIVSLVCLVVAVGTIAAALIVLL